MPLRSLPTAIAAASLAVLSAGAQAQAVQTIVRDLSAPVTATTVDFYGAPDALVGATATAYFNDGTSEQVAFVRGGTNIGEDSFAFVLTSRFYLYVTPNDLGSPSQWEILNLDSTATLMSFALDGRGFGAGAAAFDVSSAITPADTPGSNAGQELRLRFFSPVVNGQATITYSDPVALNGAAPAGDLFARVRVDFDLDEPQNGGMPPFSVQFGAYSQFTFVSDIDRAVYAPVPEPASALLLLAGTAALFARRRKALTP